MTTPNNDSYVLIEKTLSAEVLHKYLEKIRIFQHFSTDITLAQSPHLNLDDSYLWNFTPKAQHEYDAIDNDLMTDRSSFTKYEFYGLHTYGGYHGFFKPDLAEVINLISPQLPDLENIQRIYVTTDTHPNDNINCCYSNKHDRHRGKTTCYVKLFSKKV